MKPSSSTPEQRVILRAIVRDGEKRIDSIFEQEIPATEHELGLFLRRGPMRDAVARALLALNGGTVSLEKVKR